MDSQERTFWNNWNAQYRDSDRSDVSLHQEAFVLEWLGNRRNLSILDAGCGTGWLCERLTEHGAVVGTDLADEVVARAAARVPDATFVVGDIMSVDLVGPFDVVVSLEVLSHVEDHPAFLRRLHSLLGDGGHLLLATQNRPVLERFNRIAPPGEGQRRVWVDRLEMRELAEAAGFRIEELRTLTPKADRGIMRYIAKAGRVLHCSSLLERLGFGWTIMMVAERVDGS